MIQSWFLPAPSYPHAPPALTSETTGDSSQTGWRKSAPFPAASGKGWARSCRRVWALGQRMCSGSPWGWRPSQTDHHSRCIDWRVKIWDLRNWTDCQPHAPTMILLPLPLSKQVLSIPLLCLPPRFLGWYLYFSFTLHRANLWRDCLTNFTTFIGLSPNHRQIYTHIYTAKEWTV